VSAILERKPSEALMISLQSQKVMMWWFIAFGAMYGFVFIFLFRMFPPTPASWSAEDVARFYHEHGFGVRVGAIVGAWTGGWWLLLSIVLGAQMYRREMLEKGAPVWTWLTLVAGGLMTVPIALPMLFWGVAAYAPDRSPDVTALMHELGVLSWISGTQWYVFVYAAIAVMALLPTRVAHWPFPRWYGYFTILSCIALEAGALPFLARKGVLAWNGLLPWWIPIIDFAVWGPITGYLLLKAINAQIADEKSAVEHETG
jgi:hypothetical protein